MELDAIDNDETDERRNRTYSIPYWNVVVAAISIITRPCVIAMNWYLLSSYLRQAEYIFTMWTAGSILIPMVITSIVLLNMIWQDEKLTSKKKIWHKIIVAYFFRDWFSYVNAKQCRKFELMGDRDMQIAWTTLMRTPAYSEVFDWSDHNDFVIEENYKMYINEESDLAFLKLIDSFLETALQKVLQLAVILGNPHKTTYIQITSITIYFANIAWCLASYNRSIRLAQIDKHDIGVFGLMLQLFYYICLSVSRTLCIAFVASIFPIHTFMAIILRIILFGTATYIIDEPKFSTPIFSYFISVVMAVVYLFTYIPINDAPTRCKYIVYYVICFVENVICIVLFQLFANSIFTTNYKFIFHSLCIISLVFYCLGIVFMIVYYKCFHPQITARNVK